MKKFLTIALALALSLSLLSGCGGGGTGSGSGGGSGSGSGGQSADPANYPTPENPLTIQVGYVPPVGEVCDLTINEIKKVVEEQTGGAVLLELFPNSQLGNEKVLLDAILGGTLNAGLISFAQMTTVFPEAGTMILPFAFEGSDHYFRVVREQEFKEKYDAVTTAKGVHYLGVVNGPARGIIAKQAMTAPADYVGKKIRIMDGEIFADTFGAWGAGTSVIPFGECYTALQQGVIEGIDMETTMGVLMKFFEVAPHYTKTDHVIQGNGFIINTDTWNKLSPEQQEIIQNATNEMETWTESKYAEIAEEYTEIGIRDYNLQIHELTDEERQTFVDLSQGVYEKHRDKIGADYYDWFMAFVASKAE